MIAQVAQEYRPPGVVAQQRQVNHVRVGEDPPRPFPGESPHLAGAVAVVGARCDVAAAGRTASVSACAVRSWSWPSALVGDRYSARGPRIGRQRRQDRQLIGQRLARRRAGAQHHVAAVVREIGRLDLMRPRRGDAAIMNARTTSGSAQCGQACGRPCRGGRSATWRSGCLVGVGALDRAGEQLAAEIRHPVPPETH